MTDHTYAGYTAEQIRAAAEAATPGPWICCNDTVDAGEHGDLGMIAHILSSGYCMERFDALDAIHISTANPATVLALLDRIAELEAGMPATRTEQKNGSAI